MKATPIKRHRTPRYPTKLQAVEHPDLLRCHQPPAWRAVPEMAGAVVLFLAANTTACSGADKAASASGSVAIVAPVFDHGEGRGSTGCVAVAPPVFLSEEEALQVIQEELARSGVKLAEKQRVVQGMNAPVAQMREDGKGSFAIQARDTAKKRASFGLGANESDPFQVDAVDPKRHVAVEFVSTADFTRLCGHGWLTTNGALCYSSVSVFQVKDLAGFVAERVKQGCKEKLYFGTFYDPCGYAKPKDTSRTEDREAWKKRYEAAQAATAAESKRLLRLQVQDFVKWLQAQGAI